MKIWLDLDKLKWSHGFNGKLRKQSLDTEHVLDVHLQLVRNCVN